jgi:hypothetical protein
MQRHEPDRLELRFLGPGLRGQVEREDGRMADFDGWTDLGRAIHDLADLNEDPGPDDDCHETREGDRP